jgi:hypothetical protein
MSLDEQKVQDALPWLLAGVGFGGVAFVTVAALKAVQKHEESGGLRLLAPAPAPEVSEVRARDVLSAIRRNELKLDEFTSDDKANATHIGLGLLAGVAAVLGVAYAVTRSSGKPIQAMTPAERKQAGAVGQPVDVQGHQYLVAVDGELVPGPQYSTVAVAGKQRIVEPDGAINMVESGMSTFTNAGRVAAGLTGKTLAWGPGITGLLTAPTQGWVKPGVSESTTGNAPTRIAGTPLELDGDAGRIKQYGSATSQRGWLRVHVQGMGVSDAYSWFWIPTNLMQWDPPGTRLFVNADGTLSRLIVPTGNVALPGGATMPTAAPAQGGGVPVQAVVSGVQTGAQTAAQALTALTGSNPATDALGAVGSAGSAASSVSNIIGSF